jgi:hypothetical protein
MLGGAWDLDGTPAHHARQPIDRISVALDACDACCDCMLVSPGCGSSDFASAYCIAVSPLRCETMTDGSRSRNSQAAIWEPGEGGGVGKVLAMLGNITSGMRTPVVVIAGLPSVGSKWFRAHQALKLECGLMRYRIWLTLVTIAPGNIFMTWRRACAADSAATIETLPSFVIAIASPLPPE